MKLTKDEFLVLRALLKEKEINVIPQDLKDKLTPELWSLTIAQLQAKGLVEYLEGSYVLTKKAQELFKKVEDEREEKIAWGHENILATHKSTFEITKEHEISKKGEILNFKRIDFIKEIE